MPAGRTEYSLSDLTERIAASDRWFAAAMLALGLLLSAMFFPVFFDGGSPVGGDIYTYFIPQKLFYANELAAGRLPLWNDLVGFGYPILGESQTGVFYPPHLLLYGTLPRAFGPSGVMHAYLANQLLHYLATFLAAAFYARRVGLASLGCAVAATAYTFGWFPSRLCLEWAIIGGPYLPAGLLLIEAGRTQRRRLLWLGPLLGLHLLAGHFNLAFINCVTWTLYGLARLRPVDQSRRQWLSQTGLLVGSILSGFGLAGMQMLPTADFMRLSQRTADASEIELPGSPIELLEEGLPFDAASQERMRAEDADARQPPSELWRRPTYGHIPLPYWSQLVASWWWWHHPVAVADGAVNEIAALSIDAPTDPIEAHLYVGILSVLLAAWQAVAMLRRRAFGTADAALAAVGLVAAAIATGWPLLLLQDLPGFGWFIGAGRWGIVCTLALALLAGRAADRLPRPRISGTLLLVLTTADLLVVASAVTYVQMLPPPQLLDRLDESPLQELLARTPEGMPTRVHAPLANAATILGGGQWPPYLGLGPAEYVTLRNWLETPTGFLIIPQDAFADWIYAERIPFGQLANYGVRYVIATEPIEWPEITLADGEAWEQPSARMLRDPVLNRLLARGRDPLYVYDFGERITPVTTGRVVSWTPTQIRVKAAYGGVEIAMFNDGHWVAATDGIARETSNTADPFRVVVPAFAGETVTLAYRPTSLWWGLGIAALTLCGWLAVRAQVVAEDHREGDDEPSER